MDNREHTPKTFTPIRIVILAGFDCPFVIELIKRIHAAADVVLQHVIYCHDGISKKNARWYGMNPSQPGILALKEICRTLQVPLHVCGNLQSADIVALIKSLNCHVLASCAIDTVPERITSIPLLGTLGLYHGDMPAWGKAPTAFWELWHQMPHVTASVRFVNATGSEGDVVFQKSAPLCHYDDFSSVRAKLIELSFQVYPKALRIIAAGKYSETRKQNAIPNRPQPTFVHIIILRLRFFFKQLNLHKIIRQGVRCPVFLFVLLAEKAKQVILRYFGSGTLTVLYYHRVSDLCRDPITIGIGAFEKQINYLQKHYKVWKVDELKACLRQGGRLRGSHNVLITFDDGYENNYTNAFPILQKYNCEAIFFVSTGLIDNETRFTHDLHLQPDIIFNNMTWQQLQHMALAGMTIGVHSHSHANLGGLSYEAAVAEIKLSMQCFAMHLHKQPEWMSFPFGKEDNYTVALIDFIAENTPIIGLFSANGHINQGKISSYDVQRINIGDGDIGLTFKYKLRGGIRDLLKKDQG